MAPNFSRRAALLGGAGLLSGCEAFQGIVGERRQNITGTRQDVLTEVSRRLTADPQLASTAVNLPVPALRESWPQAGGDAAHSGGNPALGPTLTDAWRAGFGAGSGHRQRITSPPIAVDGSAYTVDAFGQVMAFSLDRGSRRWSRDSAPVNERASPVGGGAAFDGGVLYVASGMSEIMAIDPANGEIKWRAPTPAPARGAPTVANGRMFVPTIQNQLVAFSTEDGRQLWTHRAQTVTAVPLGLSTPAASGGLVVCGFGAGELSAMRAEDGRLAWTEMLTVANRNPLAEVAGIHAAPAVSEGRVVALGMGGVTVCMDLRSGRKVWEREVGGTSGAWISGGWVFLVTSEEQLACLGRDDGRVRWATDLRPPQTGRRLPPRAQWAPPIVAGGRLYMAGSAGQLLTVDPGTGEILGRRSLPSGVAQQPAVIGDLMLVATNNATLVALRGAGGAEAVAAAPTAAAVPVAPAAPAAPAAAAETDG